MSRSSTTTAAALQRQLEHLGMASENDFMNGTDAAALLGVHIQTLRKLARQKKIPAFKLGRDWRFWREALVRWADAQHVENSYEPGRCSVLIIDDEEKVCAALTKMVERFGCRARQTTDGQTGLELVVRGTPDIILLDFRLSKMDGPKFLAKLRQTHLHLPVVIVIGYPDSELMKEAARFAPVMLLSKPVEQAPLERTIRSQVGDRMPGGEQR